MNDFVLLKSDAPGRDHRNNFGALVREVGFDPGAGPFLKSANEDVIKTLPRDAFGAFFKDLCDARHMPDILNRTNSWRGLFGSKHTLDFRARKERASSGATLEEARSLEKGTSMTSKLWLAVIVAAFIVNALWIGLLGWHAAALTAQLF